MPVLYIVATPIGNLEDITLRALKVLSKVKLIAAEDTRTTKHLLDKYKIHTKLTSYYEYNKRSKLEYLLNLLKNEDIALVSEAGMPGISDTGYELITAAINSNVKVVAVPGASAIITALVVSGLPIDQFIYLGFLPRKKMERRRLLKSFNTESRTIVIFEAPHRLLAVLNDIHEILGNRRLTACRELTKLHEEIYRGTVITAIEHFNSPRGEFTLVLEGNKASLIKSDTELEIELTKLSQSGFKAKKATAEVAHKTGVSRKKLYKLWLSVDKGEMI